ncbi:hypothetical protein P6F26_08225 [Roseibacterium sp. SDUM158017]|uniref:hypothetical protein n=1 Tax=Roseicyclus salinarum TaxID=3036773 RepID=UPI0024151735|nr:hypothetical protein [Roseibacterium sp. SDUM158017]MDG4648429.1 hypothetical protein [Roseibacterium sp. SDUM158017]
MTPTVSAPDCDVRLSAELIALLRQGATWRQKPSPGFAETCGVPGTDSPGHVKKGLQGADFADGSVPHGRRFSLRRDGRRPMRFSGLLVACQDEVVTLAVDDRTVPVTRSLALYATDVGGTVAHVVCRPPDGHAAHAVHRAAMLDRPADLAALLASAGPEACFAVSTAPVRRLGGARDQNGPLQSVLKDHSSPRSEGTRP